MKMRIAGISCVRDEEDIIESFVRHNQSEFEKREFHWVGEVRAPIKQCKRWAKRRLGLARKT